MEDRRSKLPAVKWPEEINDQIKALKSSSEMEEFKAYRDKISGHRYTPMFHFHSPYGKINDPNGLCYYKGYYHLFYQQFPTVDTRLHWGHAVSEDLVCWKDLPTAIFPSFENGVWSGNIVVEDDRAIACYFAWPEGIAIAVSNDPLLLNWTKIKEDAVLKGDPSLPYRVYDPCLYKEDGVYYILSGVTRDTEYGHRIAVDQFRSTDLINWEWIGEFMENDPFHAPNDDGACPYFVKTGENRGMVLNFSHKSGPHILTGRYDCDSHKFTPLAHSKLSCETPGTGSLHAPSAFSDGKGGAYCVLNWYDSKWEDGKHPRTGGMTMTYNVTEGDEGKPIIAFNDAVDTLRDSLLYEGSFDVEPSCKIELPARGKMLDISLKVDLSNSKGIEIDVFASDKEKTRISWIKRNYLTIDTSASSLDPYDFSRCPETVFAPTKELGYGDIRILLDNCTVEVIVNGSLAFSTAYPSLEESDRIFISSLGGTAHIRECKIWKMKSIY